jgi:hypothetical protein
MLMWLALVLRGETAGLAEEDREDIKLLVIIYYISLRCISISQFTQPTDRIGVLVEILLSASITPPP